MADPRKLTEHRELHRFETALKEALALFGEIRAARLKVKSAQIARLKKEHIATLKALVRASISCQQC